MTHHQVLCDALQAELRNAGIREKDLRYALEMCVTSMRLVMQNGLDKEGTTRVLESAINFSREMTGVHPVQDA